MQNFFGKQLKDVISVGVEIQQTQLTKPVTVNASLPLAHSQ